MTSTRNFHRSIMGFEGSKGESNRHQSQRGVDKVHSNILLQFVKKRTCDEIEKFQRNLKIFKC